MLELTLREIEAAWERVAENAGCAGVDGVMVEDYARQVASGLPELRQQAEDGTYRALPLRRIVIGKRGGSGKTRTLLVPTVRDRILQTAAARKLSKSFEEEFLEASYGYRPGRGVDRAVARILQLRERGWDWVVDADIESYFSRVSHEKLLQLLEGQELAAGAMGLLRQWVKCVEWDGEKLIRVRRGIAQGSPISPLLANYYLTPFDRELEGGEHRLIRYADDLLILARTKDGAEQAMESTRRLLVEAGLALNVEKTRITSFEEGFRFLGVRFYGGEAMIPWKAKEAGGRLVFAARRMPEKLLRQYRKEATAKRTTRAAPHAARVVETPVAAKRMEDDMAFLYVMEQGAVVRKSGDRFLVEAEQHIAADLPYHRLEHILLFGNVQVTSQAMGEALDKGIGVSLFTRNGRYRGALVPPAGKDVALRMGQYRLYEDEGRALELAKRVVRRKIENGLAVVERFEERDLSSDETQRQRAAMGEALRSLEGASGKEQVDGFEGAAAKAYFDAVMTFNRSEFEWVGRIKHPSTDPLNALLSLSYTMIMHELSGLLEAVGFDPGVGFLHELDGSRPTLALDLMEAFRHPVADRFVLTAVNRGVFRGEDFEKRDDHGGLVLRPKAMRQFFEQYEQWMLQGVGQKEGKRVSYRKLLQWEVEGFRKYLKEGGEWAPFDFGALGGDK